jgi:hypothetical protein
VLEAAARALIAEGIERIAEQLAADGLLAGGPVAMLPLEAVGLDPARFQFRQAHSREGTTGRLADCSRFNPALAGCLLVWRDEAGQAWLCDGHHRLQLARRDGVERIACLFLQVATATEARRLAALANVAAGTADPIDLARLLRDTGADRQQLEAHGVPPRSALLRDALPLVELPPELFEQCCNGRLGLAEALALVEAGDPAAMRDLWQVAKQRGWRADRIREAAQLAHGATITSSTAPNVIPGFERLMEETGSNVDQLLAVRAEIRRVLAREVRALSVAAGAATAQVLEDTNCAVVDREAAADHRARAAVAVDGFSRLCNRPGPLADLIAQLAQEAASGESGSGALVAAQIGAIREAISVELTGTQC